MTVKEAVRVLKSAKTISLCYGDNVVPFDKDNPLSLDAFGMYVVDEIRGMEDDYYEISIAMRPVKEGDI
jgi:hypothetical protein